MNVEFLSTVAVVAPAPAASCELYVGALGLPLEGQGGGYYHRRTDRRLQVVRHLAVTGYHSFRSGEHRPSP